MESKGYKVKIGYVTLTRDQEGKFKARYRNPDTKQDVRQFLRATNLKEARTMAEKMNRELLTGKKGITPKEITLTVADALDKSIESTRANPETISRYRKSLTGFHRFLEGYCPELKLWSELRPSILEAWLNAMLKEGKAYDSIRLAFVPIKRASSYWHNEEPNLYRDIARVGKRLSIPKPPVQPIKVLEMNQMKEFFVWLAKHEPNLRGMAICMGFAGMRTREAAYLRHRDIDWQKETIRITETPLHKPKNRSSYRTIPIHPIVLETLREHIDRQPVKSIDPESELFNTIFGTPWTNSGLEKAWKRAMTAAVLDLPWLKGFQPHRLRASFATALMRANCNERLLRLYVGHSASNILTAHYVSVSIEEQREAIVLKLDEALKSDASVERVGSFLAISPIAPQSPFIDFAANG